MATQKRRMRTQLNRLAPIAAAATLLTAMVTGAFDTDAIHDADSYHERVREAIESIPYRINSWVGTDVETPPAAIKLLKPNKILQRRYVDVASGQTISLLVVHCGDMRDMRGHYPPVCYPAHGWTMRSADTTSFSTRGQQYPGAEYEFTRVVGGAERDMEIFSFFILPDGEIAPDMDALNRAAGRRSMTGLGAAQVQIIGGEDLPPKEQRELIDEFVRGIEHTIRVIAEGVSS